MGSATIAQEIGSTIDSLPSKQEVIQEIFMGVSVKVLLGVPDARGRECC